MKQQIENIIKENLPEKKETGIKMYSDKRTKEMRYLHGNSPSSVCIGCGQKKKAEEQGFNQALSQINTSLIADEVLKVVKKIGLRWYDDTYHHGKQEDGSTTFITEKEFDEFLQLLSNLSPNKENK